MEERIRLINHGTLGEVFMTFKVIIIIDVSFLFLFVNCMVFSSNYDIFYSDFKKYTVFF